MKLHKIIFSACALVMAGGCLVSCSDDNMFENDGKEAFIIGSDKTNCLTVVGRSGVKWYSGMSNDTIYVKVSPQYDIYEEIDSVYPKFFISKGSTVTPDPSQCVDLTVEGGVKYTITSEDGQTSKTYVVTHALTDFIPDGGGCSLSMNQYNKLFTELGYPGEYKVTEGVADSRLYGDLNGYIAFCGTEHFVIVGRQYSDPHFDLTGSLASENDKPNFDLGIRVFNIADGSDAGIKLNTGDIELRKFRAITSDWHGVMVGSVANGSGSDIYYWKKPTDAPTLVAHLAENVCMAEDGSNYIQVSGDITGKANIAAGAQRGKDGSHYYYHLEGGVITDSQKINSGYDSSDCGGFQMISFFSDEPESDYVVGDSEGAAGTNNTIKAYVNTFSGKTKVAMPNIVLQSQGNGGYHDWWVGSGSALNRPGARRPYVSAVVMNGKRYNMMLNGTGWWWCNTIVDADNLVTRINGAEVDFSVGCGWSFGATGDWYYDEATHTGYWIMWMDREGMYFHKLTCYE